MRRRRRRGWTAPGDQARGRRARDAPDVSLETPHRWSIPASSSTRLPTRSPTLIHVRSRRRARAPRRVKAPRVAALRRDPGPIEVARVGGTAAVPSTSSRGASHPGSLPTVALSKPGARPSPASVRNPLVHPSSHNENARLDSTLTSRPPLSACAGSRPRPRRARRRGRAHRRRVASPRPPRALPRAAGPGARVVPIAAGVRAASPLGSSVGCDASRRRGVANPRAIRDDRLEKRRRRRRVGVQGVHARAGRGRRRTERREFRVWRGR